MALDFTRHVPGIRPLLKPKDYDSKNWVHRDMTWPRTLTAWMELFRAMRTPIFLGQQHFVEISVPPYIPNTIPDPWFHRAEAANQLEVFFYQNQVFRYKMRRLFLAWAAKKMARRVIGETDVGTMEAIPAKAMVRIHDWPSRTIYQFHYQTIYRQLVGSLRYQSMALSCPKMPKNPYTNLPWSIGQLLVLYDQMQGLLWKNGGRILDPAAQIFYRSGLCLDTFHKTFQHQLDIDCALQFFHDPTSEYWDEIYMETLVDLFNFLKPQHAFVLRSLIVDRSLPKALLASWDTLLYGFWCFENLNRLVLNQIVSESDLYDKANNLIKATIAYVQRRRLVKKKENTT